MEPKNLSFLLLSFFTVVLVVVSSVESAPNNSTGAPTASLPPKVNATSPAVTKPSSGSITAPVSSNNSKSSNKTGSSSDEDCEPEAEPEKTPGSKNDTVKSGQREGKQLVEINLGDKKDKYKAHEGGAAAEPEPEPVKEKVGNSTASIVASKPGGEAEKLKGGNSSSTTTSPIHGGATNMIPSSLLWVNVIFTTLFASFTYSTL